MVRKERMARIYLRGSRCLDVREGRAGAGPLHRPSLVRVGGRLRVRVRVRVRARVGARVRVGVRARIGRLSPSVMALFRPWDLSFARGSVSNE